MTTVTSPITSLKDAIESRDADGITAQYAVGHGPRALAAGAGSVWVANRRRTLA